MKKKEIINGAAAALTDHQKKFLKDDNLKRLINRGIRGFLLLGMLTPMCASAQLTSDRADGRMTSTRGAVQYAMATHPPRLEFSPTMDADSLALWRQEMRDAMSALMRHPQDVITEAPRLVSAEPRDGYRLEKWECYPLPAYVVSYYVLVPDGVDAKNPAPASILCIPGFGQTKELLAGEVPDHSADTDPNAQAQLLAREGYVAVAVDNPSFGELRDDGVADFINCARMLLEMDWSYLGLASYQDHVILDWLKEQPYTRKDRVILSGFSLGTEPMMVLGLLDDDIFAFVYNDFLCRTRERILVMTKPDAEGRRTFPNSIEHLVPGFLMQFDFPDIVCALAPRPVICTEGGLDRDFRLIEKAFAMSGAPEAFTWYHYKKFEDPADREQIDVLPAGLDRTEYFRICNVDPPHHYYKREHILPWLHQLLK